MIFEDTILIGLLIICIGNLLVNISIISHLNQISMLTQEQFNELISRLDAATNAIAQRLQKLLDEIAAGNITDESVQAAKDDVAKLESLGKDVTDPVPPTE